jgi:hypothetical protein
VGRVVWLGLVEGTRRAGAAVRVCGL